MKNMANVDIKVLMGLEGDGGISTGSGLIIKNQLKTIVAGINKLALTDKNLQLKFKVDDTALKDIQTKIKAAIKSSTTGNSSGGTSGSSGGSKALSNQAIVNANLDYTKMKTAAKALELEGSAAKELTKALQEASIAKDKFTKSRDSESLKNLKEYEATVNKIVDREKKIIQVKEEGLRAQKNQTNELTQYDKKLRTIQDYYNKFNKKISKAGLDSEFQTTFSNLRSGNYKNSTDAEAAITKLMKKSRDAGVEVVSLKDKLSNLFGQHLGTAVAMAGVHALQTTLREVYQTVIELDAAVTNLQIATGGSKESTRELLTTYSALGKEIGATTVDVANAADAWLNKIGLPYRNMRIKSLELRGIPKGLITKCEWRHIAWLN